MHLISSLRIGLELFNRFIKLDNMNSLKKTEQKQEQLKIKN